MKLVAWQLQSVSTQSFLETCQIPHVVQSDSKYQLILLLELDSHYPEYLWRPEVLANASNSAEHLSRRLNDEIDFESFGTREELKKHINDEYVQNGLGIVDASNDELQLIVKNPRAAVYYFANMISRRAQIGWSTHGHSAVDVNIYGTVGSHNLGGNKENTDVGKFLQEYLEVDVDKITKELIAASKHFDIANHDSCPWTGRIPTEQDIHLTSRHHEKLYGKAL